MSLSECPDAALYLFSTSWLAIVAGMVVLLAEIVVSVLVFTSLRVLVHADGIARCLSAVALIVAVVYVEEGRASSFFLPQSEMSTADRKIMTVLVLLPSALVSSMLAACPGSILSLRNARIFGAVASANFLCGVIGATLVLSKGGYGESAIFLAFVELLTSFVARSGYIDINCLGEEGTDGISFHRFSFQSFGVIARCGVFLCLLMSSNSC